MPLNLLLPDHSISDCAMSRTLPRSASAYDICRPPNQPLHLQALEGLLVHGVREMEEEVALAAQLRPQRFQPPRIPLDKDLDPDRL